MVSARGLRIVFSVGALLAWCVQGLFAQNNQDIYFKYCTIHPRAECFNPVAGQVDSVGRDVTELGGGYRFCLSVDSIDAGYAPVRVILVLDNSLSMCRNPGTGANACCVDGDSTGNCMNNDPGDMRAEAAHVFVDSLRALNPQSEVGVVVFFVQASANGPLSLSSDQNVEQIHSWIDDAKCNSDWQNRYSGTPTTNLGLGLQSALSLVDKNYDELSPSMARHIILLTDGAWDDLAQRPPDGLFNTYTTGYPDRTLPVVHGVFLSDSITHVEHLYPPQGCAGNGLVDLSHLKYAADSSGGLYFPGSTPQSVTNNFMTLLQNVVKRVAQTLTAMTVTNLSNGQTRNHSSIQVVDAGDPHQVHYDAFMDDLPLVDGINLIEVQRVIGNSDNESAVLTRIDTIIIYKTTDWTSNIIQQEYDEFCVKDSTTISIEVSPPMRMINDLFTVNSTVILKDRFRLNNIQVRVFTQFPDKDANTVAVFHFEEDLVNSTNSANIGTGTVSYGGTNAVFGDFCLTQGTFSASISSLSGDFALEAWVRPVSTAAATDIFSGSDNSFGIDAEGLLYFNSGGNTVTKSTIPLDPNTWSHIAAISAGGKLVLFINGVNCSDVIPFTGGFSGAMTITCPAGGMLDEIRISNANRLRADPKLLRLDIPSVENIAWIVGDQAPVVQPFIQITPEMWNNGTIQFQFASPVAGKLVVNFQHEGTPESQWGKNGNPVLVASDRDGPYVTKAIFTPGPWGESYDTLLVFFSEPVLCDSLKKFLEPSQSFRVYRGDTLRENVFDGAYYADQDQCAAAERLMQVTIITKASINGIVPKRDSLMLVGTAVDTAGNYPDTTKKGDIEWGRGSGIAIAALPNPGIDPMAIPQGYKDRMGISQSTGKVVVVQTRGPLLPQIEFINGRIDTTYGKTVIFDAVGNVVAINKPMKAFNNDPQERKYFVVWDGTNRIGRRVGSGAYMLRATVQYENEPEKYVPLKTKFALKWKLGDL